MKTIEFLEQAVEGITGDLEKDSYEFKIEFQKYKGESFKVYVKSIVSFVSPEDCYMKIIGALRESENLHQSSGNLRYNCERVSGAYTYDMTFKVEFH